MQAKKQALSTHQEGNSELVIGNADLTHYLSSPTERTIGCLLTGTLPLLHPVSRLPVQH